jgi:hypothetical protein
MMTERELALIEKLMDTHREMSETLRAMAEAQYNLTEALLGQQVTITMSGPDEPGPTIQ